MSAPDRPSVASVEAIQKKLEEAATRELAGLTSVTLAASEIDALRYLCSLYPLSEDIRARVLRRARARSERQQTP